MKNRTYLFILLLSCLIFGNAVADELSLTQREVVEVAAVLIDKGDLNDAKILLTKQTFDIVEFEIERLYLLGRIAMVEKRLDDAIRIYRHILDNQPNLAKIRLELALAYMMTKQWYRADYHMRLAATAPDLPLPVIIEIRKYLYIIRQNKNWNLWFDIGFAPETNINGATGGEECITYSDAFGSFPYPLCRKLPEQDNAFGLNIGFGGNYEFKLSAQWRIKSDFALFGNFYDKQQYDMYYLSLSSGPRYVFSDGDVWLAATGYKMYYNHKQYRDSVGLKLDINYDFTRHLNGYLSAYWRPIFYNDDMSDYMDGETVGAITRFVYYFDASKYITLRLGLDKENTAADAYSNLRKSFSFGFGTELPFGFRVYIEPLFSWTDYDGARWTVADIGNGFQYTQIVEESFSQRYSVSLSNNNFTFWGFTPVLEYAYTNTDSNIDSRSYDKHSIGLSMQRRF